MSAGVGDLVICVDGSPCKCCGDPISVIKGRTYRIVGFGSGVNTPTGQMVHCYALEGVDSRSRHHPKNYGTNIVRFRKIETDEHEACEAEFVTLMQRSRKSVPA